MKQPLWTQTNLSDCGGIQFGNNVQCSSISMFFSELQNYQYLDLLSVLCVCDGMALPDNQEYITRAWLMSDRKNVVYYTDLGQKISREANVVYVSTDSSRTWTALADFVARVRIRLS